MRLSFSKPFFTMLTKENDKIKKFIQSAYWNTTEALAYHAILFLHQLFLRKMVHPHFYGQISTIFSSLYLITTLANLGFDQALSSFLLDAVRDRFLFKKLIIRQYVPSLILLTMICCYFYFFSQHLSLPLFFILSCTLISESTKKTAITFLELHFLNYYTNIVQILSLIGYVVIVWTLYCLDISFSLTSIFAPLLCTSLISVFFLTIKIFFLYTHLPHSCHRFHQIKITHIGITRLCAWIGQLSHSLYSSNCMVPLFSYLYGPEYAGILNIAHTVCYTMISVAKKIGGTPGSALFLHTDMSHGSTSRTHHFYTVTQVTHQFLFGGAIFCIFNTHKLGLLFDCQTINIVFLFYGLFALVALETISITYESFLITSGHAHYLAFFNAFIMCISYVTWHLAYPFLDKQSILFVLLALRALLLLLLMGFSYYRWQIIPSYRMNGYTALVALFLSALFFAIL